MSLYQRFQKNQAGRDFVVGDIHGCFDGLQELIGLVHFDKAIDRMFSVGDLVDRGPKSQDALAWLLEPWFHAVRGNHEQMAINFQDGHNHAFHYERNGGRWFIDLDEKWQKEFAEAFAKMPLVIDVKTDSGLVGIVHAEPVPYDWPVFTALIESGNTQVRDVAMWARDRIELREEEPVDGVHKVYVGHTPLTQPVALGNVVYLDTGAVFGGSLTAICLNDGQFYSVKTSDER